MSFPKYPKYKDSGVEWLGDVPEHWAAGRLRYITDLIVDGTHHSPASMFEGERLYITAKNVKEHGFDFSDITYVTEADHREIFPRCPVKKGDVLYIKDGATAGIAMVNPLDVEFSMLSSVALIRPAPSKLDPRFVAYHLNAGQFKSNALNQLVGGAMTRFTLDMISRFRFSIPPLSEQTAIARFLDAETSKIDALIAEQRRLIELLKEKRQAVISHAVTKGLNPNAPMKASGIEWLGDVPEHWRVLAYGHLVTRVVVGIAEAATHAYAEEGVPIVRSTNIKTGKIDQSQMLFINPKFASKLASKALHAGDVVITRTGANVGVSAVVPESLHMSQCFTLVISSPKPESNPEYYNHFINSTPGRLYIDLTAWGSGQPNISVPIIQRMQTVAPPREEQDEIVSFIESASGQYDGLIAQATRAIDLLQERRTALISAAVTGKIDVRGFASVESA